MSILTKPSVNGIVAAGKQNHCSERDENPHKYVPTTFITFDDISDAIKDKKKNTIEITISVYDEVDVFNYIQQLGNKLQTMCSLVHCATKLKII